MPSSSAPRPIDDIATRSILEPFDRDVLLGTGRAVQVRPAGVGDVDRLRSFYSQLSQASTYYRFFGVRRFIPDEELQRATVHDVRHRVTLVCESEGVIIGVGEYHVSARGEEAEVAFAVADAHQHEGVATVLLEDLALIARAAGMRRLVAETLPDNEAMKGVFRSVGLVNRIWFEDGVIQVQLDLTGEHLLQDDADLRDWKAAVRSLRPLVDPSHVVVVGAGQDPESPGARILARLRESFTGQVSAMVTADGLDELATTPDLTIVAVPAPEVAEVLDRCGAAGVPTAVVISAGFAETGPEGARMQDDVLAIARRHGMRLVGPNSLGVVSTACGLNASLTGHRFNAGGIAIASQSGGVGIAIAAEARRRHAGISSFVSMGNKADVSGNDLLRLWAEDDQTTVVLLYLESFGDPVRFARVARAVSKRKPVIALKSGRSAPGIRGALSHTAALASDHGAVDALFAHTGVVRAGTLEELIDVALLLDRHPAPAGARVALIGNSRGPLILGADAADANGLDVPILSASVRDEVASHVPAAASTANPVDLGPGVTSAQLASVIQTIVGSGEVDACIVAHVDMAGPGGPAEPPLLVTSGLDRFPVALSLIGQDRDADPGPFAVFPTPERAARAVALAASRAGWLSALDGDSEVAADATVLDANSFVDARRLARAHAGAAQDTSWLEPAESFALLEAAGVPVAPWRYARSADECAVAADDVGFPCVVKADVAELTHKSDVGAVRLGVGDRIIAADAYTSLRQQFGGRMRGAVVQAQAVGSLELLVGAIRDPAFGPFVVVGAGGVETDLRDDRIMLVAPVARSAARGAVEGLRLAPLFHGFRGRPEVPVDPVVDLVQRIGVLAASVPEIQQLDMNPVLVGPHGCVAVDALVGVAAPPASGPARAMRGASSFAEAPSALSG